MKRRMIFLLVMLLLSATLLAGCEEKASGQTPGGQAEVPEAVCEEPNLLTLQCFDLPETDGEYRMTLMAALEYSALVKVDLEDSAGKSTVGLYLWHRSEAVPEIVATFEPGERQVLSAVFDAGNVYVLYRDTDPEKPLHLAEHYMLRDEGFAHEQALWIPGDTIRDDARFILHDHSLYVLYNDIRYDAGPHLKMDKWSREDNVWIEVYDAAGSHLHEQTRLRQGREGFLLYYDDAVCLTSLEGDKRGREPRCFDAETFVFAVPFADGAYVCERAMEESERPQYALTLYGEDKEIPIEWPPECVLTDGYRLPKERWLLIGRDLAGAARYFVWDGAELLENARLNPDYRHFEAVEKPEELVLYAQDKVTGEIARITLD